MVSVPDDSSFIIRLRHQLIFGIDKNWTLMACLDGGGKEGE